MLARPPKHHRKTTIFCTSGALLLLSACATSVQSQKPKALSDQKLTNRQLITDSVTRTGKSIPDAARAPLRDLNLMKEEIPPLLLSIDYPYKIDGPVYCDNLIAEVSALDDVLGVGLDHYKEKGSLNEQAAEAATNAATNALEDAATGWIPYRSVLRRLTGATKHERALAKAYQRGRIRRAFLKGIGGAFQCPYPARPSSVEQPMLAPEGASRSVRP